MTAKNIPELNEGRKRRFWEKVEKAGVDECWEWKAARSTSGYGVFGIPGDQYRAHRIAFSLAIGPIADGLWVLHRCDNRGCVNPAHLFLGTSEDNIADMLKKGRNARGDKSGARLHPEKIVRGDRHHFRLHPELAARGDRHGSKTHPECVCRGEKNGRSRLKQEQVLEIRSRYAHGGTSFRKLAREFGVSKWLISNIIKRIAWAAI